MSARSRAAEQLRRASARATEEIVLRHGRDLDMYVGCGYPKSGTVWLCQLMGGYLGVPYPQNYLLPVAMSAVVHAHWEYDSRLPPTAYLVRDGRDVLTSLFFYEMRALRIARNPGRRRRRQERYDRLFGPGFDPDDVAALMPRFVEAELTDPVALRGVAWHQHVSDWTSEDRPQVAVVRYEDLLDRPLDAFGALMSAVTGAPADEVRTRVTLERFAFARSGREAGQEDRSAFMRKGVHGDWRRHFTRDSARIVDQIAGRELRRLGYAHDGWVEEL